MNETIHIVACLDNGYVMPTGVMMYSVCVNNQDADITFHLIIDESVTQKAKCDLKDTVEEFVNKRIVFYEVDSQTTKDLPTRQKCSITQATYYRLYLTEIIPQTIDKVLYFDGDVIIRHSLVSLWETDLTGYAVAASIDMSSANIEYYNRLRYPFDLGYFNAGVLLINLDYWRKHHVINLFSDFISNHSDIIRCEDQDVLNVVFCNHKLWLSVKYNLQHGFLRKNAKYDYWKYEKEVVEARKDPLIVHYTFHKPWEKSTKEIHPFSSSFEKYQKQTIWKNIIIDKRSTMLKIRSLVGQILGYFRLRQRTRRTTYIDILPID